MEQLDFKKLYKDLYLPPKKPVTVEVPAMRFLMVDGQGDPDEASYQEAVGILYSVLFTIKMSDKKGNEPTGFQPFAAPPLEGLWRGADGIATGPKQWQWTSLLRVPDFVTADVVDWAAGEARRKKPELDYARLRLDSYEEGLCVQMLHIGPYATEPESLALLAAYAEEQGLIEDISKARPHHELYLSNPQRTAPDKLRTVLRTPVRRPEG